MNNLATVDLIDGKIIITKGFLLEEGNMRDYYTRVGKERKPENLMLAYLKRGHYFEKKLIKGKYYILSGDIIFIQKINGVIIYPEAFTPGEINVIVKTSNGSVNLDNESKISKKIKFARTRPDEIMYYLIKMLPGSSFFIKTKNKISYDDILKVIADE